MAWIKRNLFFVSGSIIALALMGLAGFYLYSKWQLNNSVWEQLKTQYDQLDHLNKEKPHPGAGSVDNIQAAKDQQKQLRDYLQQTRKFYQRIPAIPSGAKVTGQEFSAALHRSIDQMQRSAANTSVNLSVQDYSFSFAAQRHLLNFSQGSLEPLALQLGEIRAICDVLFDAKVNSLDNLRRERVSLDDQQGLQTDYLVETSVTNELAVVTPYELTFRGFSSELAAVLAGFASSPYGIIVKTVNVEQAAPGAAIADAGATPAVMPVAPAYTPYPQQGGYPPGGYRDRFARGEMPAAAPPPAAVAPMTPAAAPVPGARGGLPTVLDEKQLKITMMLDVVKLLPTK